MVVAQLLEALDETFEQVHGIYLDKGTSLFETLATITAEQASQPVGGRCATLAAQVAHVDLYLGGAEHATGHLLYVRFWTKFLFDLGLIPILEPAKKLINQGMIQGLSMFCRLFNRNLKGSDNVEDVETFMITSNSKQQFPLEGAGRLA